MSRLPTPEQWLIDELDEMETAEMIESNIGWIDPDDGHSVHLGMPFVRHYMKRPGDTALPTTVAIATQPIVLADGEMFAQEEGLDKESGIHFKIQKELMDCVPRRADCDDEAVCVAIRYLTDVWLVDVKTNFIGKCIIIAAALTIIERSLLDSRPVFVITAGHRGCGKTTTLMMLIMAVTGMMPAAATWASNTDERRKALLSYFMAGMSYILWDNIPRGTAIACPHLERSCTSAFYADRKLGVSETVATAASTIHFFTGNNIGMRGDLASRSLQLRLEVDRRDPENRDFTHPDGVGWTEAHRVEIMRAFYTILLGNPQLDEPRNAPGKTRFKMWWRVVGSAIEHAAKVAGEEVDFKALFLAQDDEDEEASSLADALEVLERYFGTRVFSSNEVLKIIISSFSITGDEALREVLYPDANDRTTYTAKSVGKRLKNHIDHPTMVGDRLLILRGKRDTAQGAKSALQFHLKGAKPREAVPEYLAATAGPGT